jgi:hypothetical protein
VVARVTSPRPRVGEFLSEEELDILSLSERSVGLEYSYRAAVAPEGEWDKHVAHCDKLSVFYKQDINVLRHASGLAESTRKSMVSVARGYIGFVWHYLEMPPSFESFLDGAAIQMYVRFLRQRDVAFSTIVKNLGHVSRALTHHALPLPRLSLSLSLSLSLFP